MFIFYFQINFLKLVEFCYFFLVRFGKLVVVAKWLEKFI